MVEDGAQGRVQQPEFGWWAMMTGKGQIALKFRAPVQDFFLVIKKSDEVYVL